MKRLMVRADDLGFSKGINYGILETVKSGTIKNIGLMVNMPYSIHGYNLVKDYDICLGQHTNICVGKPVSDPSLIPSLVQENGEFKSSKMYRQAKEDIVVLEEAIIEVEAQYKRFKEITNREPAYFEAHAVMSPNLMKAIEIVGNKYNLKVLGFAFGDKPVLFNNQPMYMYMGSMIENYNPLESFKKMFNEAKEGYNMMIFHPGYLDDYILKVSSLTTARTIETEMLCSKEFKDYLIDNRIELCTYDDVK